VSVDAAATTPGPAPDPGPAVTSPAATTTGPRVPGWVRWTACGVLLVLTAVLALASLVARYADRTLLDTDRYVALVGPLAGEPAVQAQVVDVVTDQVMARIDVESATVAALDALAAPVDGEQRPLLSARATRRADDAAAVLAPVLAREVEGFVRDVVDRVVTSPRFAAVWEAVNRTGHRAVVVAVTGEGEVVRAGPDGTVTVGLGPVVDVVRSELTDRGFSLAERIPAVDPEIVVGRFPEVETAQRVVVLLDRAAASLPWFVVALAALAVWAAPVRRRGVGLVGVAWAFAGLLLVVGLALGRSAYLDAPAVSDGATGVVYDRIVGPLRVDAWWLVAVGAVLLAVVVLGPRVRDAVRASRPRTASSA